MGRLAKNKMFSLRVRRLQKKVRVDTQKIRQDLMKNLKELFNLSSAQAKNTALDLEQRQFWVRVAGYVAQVINSVSKSFDEAFVTLELRRLEKIVNEAVATAEVRGNRGSSKKSNPETEKPNSK